MGRHKDISSTALVPPDSVMSKPSLKGKKEVSRGKGEACRPESREHMVVGSLGVQAFWQLSIGFPWGNNNHSTTHRAST